MEANSGADRLQQSRMMLAALISGVTQALIILHDHEIIRDNLQGVCLRAGGHRIRGLPWPKMGILVDDEGYSAYQA